LKWNKDKIKVKSLIIIKEIEAILGIPSPTMAKRISNILEILTKKTIAIIIIIIAKEIILMSIEIIP